MALVATTKDNVTVLTWSGAGLAIGNVFLTAPGCHERYRVKVIRWVAPSAVAGNRFVLGDVNSNVVWESVANGPNWTDQTNYDDDFRDGLQVLTWDGGAGTVYLYHALKG